jgi:Protein of unknown function (DUF1682)
MTIDFVDFAAAAPDPLSASTVIPSAADYTGLAIPPTGTGVPYTKWYNVHERYSLSDFKQEGVILIVIAILTAIHLMGTRANRAKAKVWIAAHAPILEKEFALVGFGGRKAPTVADVEGEGLLKSMSNEALDLPVELLKEKSLNEFSTYATGRQNIAFVDFDLTLYKRYNPLSAFAESAIRLFIDSFPATVERMTATIYPFDGKEALTVPGQIPGAHELKSRDSKSSYDGFVWAVVNKEGMKALRDERYDVSITSTKDNPKLPMWATIMSEAAEITDLLLTPELVKAVEQAGELLDYIIITDQPIDKPKAYGFSSHRSLESANEQIESMRQLPRNESTSRSVSPILALVTPKPFHSSNTSCVSLISSSNLPTSDQK